LKQRNTKKSKNMNIKTTIELEDSGQDFLLLNLDEDGVILSTEPFQTSVWKGGAVPMTMVKIGKELPIHKPPHINFGFLKHKVKSITNHEIASVPRNDEPQHNITT